MMHGQKNIKLAINYCASQTFGGLKAICHSCCCRLTYSALSHCFSTAL